MSLDALTATLTRALSSSYDIASAIVSSSLPVLKDYGEQLQEMGKELAEVETPTLQDLQKRVSATSTTLLEISGKTQATAEGLFYHVQAQWWLYMSQQMEKEPEVVLKELEDEDGWEVMQCMGLQTKGIEEDWQEVNISFEQIFEDLGITSKKTQKLLIEVISKKDGWEFLDEHKSKNNVKENTVYALAMLLYQEDLEKFCSSIQDFPLSDSMVRDFVFEVLKAQPTYVCIYLNNFLIGHPHLRDQIATEIKVSNFRLFCGYLPVFGYEKEEECFALAEEMLPREPRILCEVFHHFPIKDTEKILSLVNRLAPMCFADLARNFHKFAKHLSVEQRWAFVHSHKEEHARDICVFVENFMLQGSQEVFNLAMFLLAKTPQLLVQKMECFSLEEFQYKALVDEFVKTNGILLLDCLHKIPIEDEEYLYHDVADVLARRFPVKFYEKFPLNFRRLVPTDQGGSELQYRLNAAHRRELAYVVSVIIMQKPACLVSDEMVYDALGFPGQGIYSRVLSQPLSVVFEMGQPPRNDVWDEEEGTFVGDEKQ